MFFNRFETISYDPLGTGRGKDAKNILNSILVKYHPVTNAVMWFYHTIKEGETPEIIAHIYYGNINYHWIVLFMNQMVDPFYDWTLSSQKFAAMMTDRYGAGNEGKVHHMVDLTNNDKRIDEVAQMDAEDYFIANGFYPQNIRPISNHEFESDANDVRREVKILRRKYINGFINQFDNLMNRETFA